MLSLGVGFHKTRTGKPSVTWSESVDQALCFGWIDGIRKSIDENSYMIRFTPRKSSSIWSAINIKKVEQLTEQGMMKPAGLAAFDRRQEKKSRIYSFEQKEVKFTPAFLKIFKSNKNAWKFFSSQPPSYQRPATWWVISAKQEETKNKRLQELIRDSEEGLRVKHLRRTKKST
jgi:uncharacterized protein YdeI (YjbR/CyaY-like superfamily)